MNYDNSHGAEFLHQVNDLISEHMEDNEFGVSAMANAMAMSRSSLHRRFKEITGFSTSEFLRNCRLERAKTLLKTSSATISEVAYACGFNSLAYFDQRFKTYFGFTPGEFREQTEVDFPKRPDPGLNIDWASQPAELEPLNARHNFPVYLTSFIGRLEELPAIQAMLKEHRIISLVGPGGCGKTRLATETVNRLQHKFNDGVWFVDLSSITVAEYVPKEIMKVFGIPEVAGEETQNTLIDRLQQNNLLLVLDNCEHLENVVGPLISNLVRAVPGLKVLLTSRKVLGIQGEKVWQVAPLSVVQPGRVTGIRQARESEAVLLFMDRAKLVDQQFELVDKNSRDIARICFQLDGIPLALELVASRVRYMEPVTIIARLATSYTKIETKDPQAIDRHKNLNRAIQWGYNLLLDEQKELFRRLSVFTGGFDLEAAEAVCADKNIPADYIHDFLADLVDCSMLNTKRTSGKHLRYYMLQTIRQFASSLNNEKDVRRLNKKHLIYFLDLTQAAYQERMTNQADWMSRLGLEFENIMAALSWAKKYNMLKYRSLAGLVGWWWVRSGYNVLAEQVLDELVEEGKLRAATKARVYSAYSWSLAGYFERYDELIIYGKKAAAIWHRAQNRSEEAIVLTDLALTKLGINANEEGLVFLRQAQELVKENDDPGVRIYVLTALSQALVNLKRCDKGQVVQKELLSLSKNLNNNFGMFVAHHNAADCAAIQRHFAMARINYAKGLKTCVKMGDMPYALNELMGIAIAEAGLGNYGKALQIVGANNAIAKKVGVPSRELLPMQFWQEFIHEYINGARQKVEEGLRLKYEAEGATMEFEEVVDYALEFEHS